MRCAACEDLHLSKPHRSAADRWLGTPRCPAAREAIATRTSGPQLLLNIGLGRANCNVSFHAAPSDAKVDQPPGPDVEHRPHARVI